MVQFKNSRIGRRLYRRKVKRILLLFTIQILTTQISLPVQASSQPFLNSLAVLFRARPSWPNIYSANSQDQSNTQKLQNYPKNGNHGGRFSNFGRQKPLVASASTNGKPGILIAQPMGTRKPVQFKFLPQTKPQHTHHHPGQVFYTNSISSPQGSGFVPSPIINSQAFHDTRPHVNTQSQFTPIIATDPPANGQVKFPESSTESPVNPISVEDSQASEQTQFEKAHVQDQEFDDQEFDAQEFHESKKLETSPPQKSSHYSKTSAWGNEQDAHEGGSQSKTAGSEKKISNFRPSPMLPDSGGIEYNREFQRSYPLTSDTKSSASFSVMDAKDPPRYESGFKPISYHQYAAHYGTTASHEVYKNSHAQWDHSQWNMAPTTATTTEEPRVQDSWSPTTLEPKPQEMKPSDRDTGRYYDTENVKFASTPSSSERSEEWVKPIKKFKSLNSKEVKGPTAAAFQGFRVNEKLPTASELTGFRKIEKLPTASALTGFRTTEKLPTASALTGFSSEEKSGRGMPQPASKSKQSKFPVYNKSKDKPRVRVRPSKCEQFHRFGFCPVTPHYPLSQVESIASRCAALLAHLIAPLPKTEVHYDIVMTRNTSRKTPRLTQRQKMPKNKGWSWKDFKGSPICDTEEVKITPGWAKNEDGEWLVILQTEFWKQEAQISICSFAHDSPAFKRHFTTAGTKCVQRFTAQRLAVLDPENQDRCPIIRSVYLPSACICLSEKVGSSSTSVEESTVGSVTPNFSSSEEVIDPDSRQIFGSREARSFPAPGTARGSSSDPILIQNGTFLTTLVVTEETQQGSIESTPPPS